MTLNTTLSQLLIDGPLSFESSQSVTYAREVQTDINGHLAQICDQALKGETPMNAVEKKNMLYEYSFYTSTNDTVEVKMGSNSLFNQDQMQVTNVVQLQVLTNQLSSGDYQGVVYKNFNYTPCEDGARDFKVREQTFNPPN